MRIQHSDFFGKWLHQAKPPCNDDIPVRREHTRRNTDRCVVVIDECYYPVTNWSQGGILISADSRLFAEGQHAQITLKFKLKGQILDINHSGRIIRKDKERVAFEFDPLNASTERYFQRVINESQVAL